MLIRRRQREPGLSGQSRNPNIVLWDRRTHLGKLGRDLPVKKGGLFVRGQQDHGIQKPLDPGETRLLPVGTIRPVVKFTQGSPRAGCGK